MYVTVSSTGAVTFRYESHLNGRREILTMAATVLPEFRWLSPVKICSTSKKLLCRASSLRWKKAYLTFG